MKPTPWLALGLAVLLSAGCGGSILPHVPFINRDRRHLPEDGAVPGLAQTTQVHSYGSKDLPTVLGKSAGLYINYGAHGMSTADYILGTADRGLTIQSFSMEDGVAAAGIFHHFRGRRLGQYAQRADAGAEAVLDTQHEKRNLYFYKKRYFVKIIYTGDKPVPDLIPLGRAVAAGIPGGKERPRGFEYIEVEGVDADSAHVTAGYTFNCDFLPPGIMAKAPGAGSVVAEVFLIGHLDKKDAQRTGRDYRTYLQLNGKDYDSRTLGWHGRKVWWARDPSQGRVICTVYKEYVIGVVRPKEYELGEAIINRIIRRMGGKP